jgi:hypothetical protein
VAIATGVDPTSRKAIIFTTHQSHGVPIDRMPIPILPEFLEQATGQAAQFGSLSWLLVNRNFPLFVVMLRSFSCSQKFLWDKSRR